MNPYLATGLAMCAIVFLALVGTAYLAVHFNRRAKADLLVRLEPLATAIDGTIDLDEATVAGRHRGHIADGRVANTAGGQGRVFYTRIIDPAGGTKWQWTATQPRTPEEPREITVECADDSVKTAIERNLPSLAQPLVDLPNWTRVEYDPEAGHVRLTKPMRTRHDIPTGETFVRQLDALVAIGEFNRSLMQPEQTA